MRARSLIALALVALAGLLGGCGDAGESPEAHHQAQPQRPACRWEPELCDTAARQAWIEGQR